MRRQNAESKTKLNLSRRQFLANSATTAIAAAYLNFPQKTYAANGDTLKVGLVGCGGRGTGAAAQALAADKNIVLTAMADAFEDRLKSSLEILKKQAQDRIQVDPDHCFIGFDGYQKLI